MQIKNEDVQIGQHCWAMSAGKLLVVLKVYDESYEVCGAWECGIGADELELIEIIDRPEGHNDTKLYYLFDS